MYVVPPPQRSDSNADLRVYQTWKGSNIFFLQGRFVFGPDVRSLALTICLIAVPVTIFCIFVARKLMDDFSDSWGVSILAVAVLFTIYDLILLLVTSGKDPGIIPRNAHPPEPEALDGNMDAGSGQTPQMRLPRIKEVEVNGVTFKVLDELFGALEVIRTQKEQKEASIDRFKCMGNQNRSIQESREQMGKVIDRSEVLIDRFGHGSIDPFIPKKWIDRSAFEYNVCSKKYTRIDRSVFGQKPDRSIHDSLCHFSCAGRVWWIKWPNFLYLF